MLSTVALNNPTEVVMLWLSSEHSAKPTTTRSRWSPRVGHIVGHGLAVFDDQHGELCCVGGHQICVGEAGTIAVVGFHDFNIEFTDVLPCEFSVQDVSLYFCPAS